MTGFAPVVLDALRIARTVEIETSAGPGRPVHRTVIWIVVDDEGRVFVRSCEAAAGGGTASSWPIRPAPFTSPVLASRPAPSRHLDAARVAACSAALAAKYATSRGSLAAMVAADVLETTLELRPAGMDSASVLRYP